MDFKTEKRLIPFLQLIGQEKSVFPEDQDRYLPVVSGDRIDAVYDKEANKCYMYKGREVVEVKFEYDPDKKIYKLK